MDKAEKPHNSDGVTCPGCSYFFKGHSNLFGKICGHCGFYIPPEAELPIVSRNRQLKDRVVREHVWPILRKMNKRKDFHAY